MAGSAADVVAANGWDLDLLAYCQAETVFPVAVVPAGVYCCGTAAADKILADAGTAADMADDGLDSWALALAAAMARYMDVGNLGIAEAAEPVVPVVLGTQAAVAGPFAASAGFVPEPSPAICRALPQDIAQTLRLWLSAWVLAHRDEDPGPVLSMPA